MIRTALEAALVALARFGAWALHLPNDDDDWQGIT